MKRLLTFLMAMVMVLSLIPAVSFAAETRTVYWDPASGADTNDGLTEAAPVKTVAAAYSALSGADEGVLVLLGTLKLTALTNFPTCGIPVTITSKTGAEGISSSANINFNGETTLENLTLTLTKASTSALIGGGGHKFTVGEGVTCVPFSNTTSDYYFCLQGGLAGAGVASTDLTVKSGTWRNIYFGSMSRVVSGDAKLTMTGGSAAAVTPSYSSSVNGNVSATIGGTARITSYLYAGCWTKGDVGGNVDITLQEGASVYRLFCAGNGTGNVAGTVTVNWDGMTESIYNFKGIGNTSHSGTIGGSRLVLKSGVFSKVPTGFDDMDIEIPAGKALTLSASVTVDNVTGDGTLCFTGAPTLTAASVTGTVKCAIDGFQYNNHPYIQAPAVSGFVFENNLIPEVNGTWIKKDLENFQGLVLTAAKGVTVTLYTGFDPESTSVKKVEPYAVENNTYYYPALQGNYYYRASGTGYYKVKKNIYMSEEKSKTKTVIDVTPEKRSGLGWEPTTSIKYYTDEFIKNAAPSDPALWPEFSEMFTTPAFGEDRAEHQHTTQAEMESFIASLDGADDNMYVYSSGASGRGQDMPVVIFTRLDLTGKTLEEAAAMIVADSERNGKLTVHNQAHMHGNEQAAGETALGWIKMLDGAYGETLLDNLNIYVMPRLNPDGAQDDLRRIPTWGNKDPNGDMVQMETVEMQNVMYVMNLFKPHVFIDNHEGNVAVDSSTVSHGYFLVNPSFNTQSSEDFRQLGLSIVAEAFDNLEEKGFAYRYIDNIINSKNMGVGRCYAGSMGMLAFLIESPGIYNGRNGYERRVAGAATVLTTFYNYVNENTAQVKSILEAEQQRIIENGKTYEESDIVVLETASTARSEYNYQTPIYNGATGEVTELRTMTPKVYDTVVRSRVAPTAYVLPAGEAWVSDVMKIMDFQQMEYYQLPAGSTVTLQQYTGNHSAAGLTEEKAVTFEQGAYVFTMDQQKAVILAAMLEPDTTDVARSLTSGNGYYIATSGETHTYIEPVNGLYPIYRYIHDLNEDGTIDLTDAPETPDEPETPAAYTVYLKQSAADDTGDGYTEETAVQTVDRAYAQLALQMANAPAGTEGTVVLLEDYAIPGQSIDFPECAFPVTLTSKTGNEGFIYSPTSAVKQEYRTIGFNGETTLENITIHYTSGKLISGMKANGHKLTIGENVNVVVPTNGYYLNIYGGTYLFGEDVQSTDVTILSGTWRNAYVGGFGKKVLGDARLTVDGADFTAKIMAQYSGGIQGNMYVSLKNTTVGNNVHGGGAKDNISGDVEIRLGEGFSALGLYAGNTTSGNVLGTVTFIFDGADLSKTPIHGMAQGTGSVHRTVLQLEQDMATDLTLDGTVELDLCGYDITGNVTVDGTLTVKDSATDDYDVSDGLCGEITGTVTGTLAAAEGYVAAAKGFHKFDQYISGVSLRPSNAGIYYTATVLADEVLRSEFASQGVAVSLTDLPGSDFETDEDTLYATGSNGVLVRNILTGDSEDADRGIMDIYAASYVKLQDGTVLVSDENVAYSLYDVLLLIREQSPDALNNFLTKWNIQSWFN